MERQKPEVMTFKVEAELALALRRVPNRSEFIRNALWAALTGTCPLCGGTGRLDVDQRRHWDAFATSHGLEECQDCHALHLVCQSSCSEGGDDAHEGNNKPGEAG